MHHRDMLRPDRMQVHRQEHQVLLRRSKILVMLFSEIDLLAKLQKYLDCAISLFISAGGGGHITCGGYGYLPPIWVGFWVKNSLNKGPFFGRLSSNMGGLSRNLRKIAKMGGFPPIHHKSGYDRKFR